MKRILPAVLSCIFLSASAHAQDGTQLTPNRELGLSPKLVEIPQKFSTMIPENFSVNLPPGFRAKFFFTDTSLVKPRFMTWGPDSTLYLADNGNLRNQIPGKIVKLPDMDHDGTADSMIVVASNVSAHSIAFYKGALYAAETDRVLRLTDVNGDGFYEMQETFISGIPGLGRHHTRTIVFDSLNRKLYLSIGSEFNARRENTRALIMEYNDDGTNGRIYATGIRNAVGMTLHPVTGRLWATNNGSDLQGDNIPHEWIDQVRDGGFYGYPYAYHYRQFFPTYEPAGDEDGDYRSILPLTTEDTMRLQFMQPAAALIQAHSAPMAIEFPGQSFHQNYRNGAIVALRGAWNTTLPKGVRPGYRVVYLDFDNAGDTIANSISDFITGFQRTGGEWARPVGLETDSHGNLYLSSDDSTKFVMIISPDVTQGTIDNEAGESLIEIYPNPASDEIFVRSGNPAGGAAEISILNMLGEKVFSGSFSASGRISLRELPSGSYIVKISDGTYTRHENIQVIR